MLELHHVEVLPRSDSWARMRAKSVEILSAGIRGEDMVLEMMSRRGYCHFGLMEHLLKYLGKRRRD